MVIILKKYKIKDHGLKLKMILTTIKVILKKSKFPPSQKNTHKVYTLYANLYLKPNSKSKIKQKLSFGSKIKVLKKKGALL